MTKYNASHRLHKWSFILNEAKGKSPWSKVLKLYWKFDLHLSYYQKPIWTIVINIRDSLIGKQKSRLMPKLTFMIHWWKILSNFTKLVWRHLTHAMWCSSQVNNTVTEGSDHQEMNVYLISHSKSILSILIEELKIQLRIFAIQVFRNCVPIRMLPDILIFFNLYPIWQTPSHMNLRQCRKICYPDLALLFIIINIPENGKKPCEWKEEKNGF